MDKEIAKIVSILIIAIVGISWGAAIIINVTFVGNMYDVKVTVQAVEKSTRFGEHTNVWGRVYGDQDITYVLIGHHDFEVDETYRIVFINRFAIAGWGIRGEVISVEKI